MSDQDDKRPPEEPETPAEGSPEQPQPSTPQKAAGDGEAGRSAEDPSGEAGDSPAADAAPSAEEEAAQKAKAAAEAQAKKEAAAKAKAAAEAAKPPWLRDPDTPQWEDAAEDPLVRGLRTHHAEAIVAAQTFAGELELVVTRDGLRELAFSLKNDHGFRLFVDACGVDFPDREEGRFDVVYIVYDLKTERRVRIKVVTDEATEVPSLVPVWVGADWPEREIYDMYGVRFTDHPDMTRILLWEGFNGYPLRKDFPIEGIDTGAAIYPEYYEQQAGPVSGTGTGWKPAPPPEPSAETEAAGEETPDS